MQDIYASSSVSTTYLNTVQDMAATALKLGCTGVTIDQERYTAGVECICDSDSDSDNDGDSESDNDGDSKSDNESDNDTPSWEYECMSASSGSYTQSQINTQTQSRGEQFMTALVDGFSNLEVVLYHTDIENAFKSSWNSSSTQGYFLLGMASVDGYACMRHIDAHMYKPTQMGSTTYPEALSQDITAYGALFTDPAAPNYVSPFIWIDTDGLSDPVVTPSDTRRLSPHFRILPSGRFRAISGVSTSMRRSPNGRPMGPTSPSRECSRLAPSATCRRRAASAGQVPVPLSMSPSPTPRPSATRASRR